MSIARHGYLWSPRFCLPSVWRHNIRRDILYDCCSLAAWGPTKEVPHIFPSSSERPAGIFVPNFLLGKDLVLDVAMTCPLQHKHLLEAAQTVMITPSKNKSKTIRKELKGKVLSTSLLFLNHLGVSHTISLIFYSN